MTTRNSPLPTYTDLARVSAVLQRELSPSACARLREAVAELGPMHMQLGFRFDDQQRILLEGFVHTRVQLQCQLCSEPVSIPLRVELAGVLARSEPEAQAWQAAEDSLNIIVVSSTELDEAELVEDELLLQLPSQVCSDAACERRPRLNYPPMGEQPAADTHRPFAVLADLKLDNR